MSIVFILYDGEYHIKPTVSVSAWSSVKILTANSLNLDLLTWAHHSIQSCVHNS